MKIFYNTSLEMTSGNMFNSAQLKRYIRIWKRQKTKIIAVAGTRKAGKDVFIGYLMRNYKGFKHVRIADAPQRIARMLGLPADRRIYHALFGVNSLLKPIIGESAFKKRAAMILDKEHPRLAIVEALRTKEEYQEFVVKRNGILVGIKARGELRYQRALKDARRQSGKLDEGKMTLKEFLSKETSPIEREISYIMGKAHIVLTNDYRSHQPFYDDIKKAIAVTGLKPKK